MFATFVQLREKRGWWFDVTVFAAGITLFAATLYAALLDGVQSIPATVLVTVPVIALVARFPMVIDSRDGGIEVGFDSTLLMFLLCTLDSHDALLLWSIGVLLTQLTSAKRLSSVLFNIGVGICAGGLATVVLALAGGGRTDHPGDLVAVILSAAAYFAVDYGVSAMSVAITSGTAIRDHLVSGPTLVAVACFVPFDTMGYLSAVLYRTSPWYTQILLAVPLVTMLVATRAVSRGKENARRLAVLFDAAVKAQTLADRGEVTRVLLEDTRLLLHVSEAALRDQPPTDREIGARVDLGAESRWIVTPALGRARSTVDADRHALRALAAVASDAFARLALTEEMVHVARHDPLTDLPNRGILQDRLHHALEVARRRDAQLALLFIDLDGFKPVNDRFGHAAGDAVLVALADRLRSCVRASDTLARLGGDEFAVLFEDVDPRMVEQTCQRVLAAVAEGASVVGQHLPLSASAGIAFAGPTDSAEILLRKADMAMYEAKARGKARVVAYEDAIGRSRIERLELVDELRRAIEHDEIDVVYQPVVTADTGRVVGVEALARWHRDGGSVPPGVFIAIAEETGQINALGQRVLVRAAADAATLGTLMCPGFVMSVNISARQLREQCFVDEVRDAVDAMDAMLVLEITEREGLDVDPVVLESMNAIAAMGVRFAIDDFGVGFSSISYLQDLPVQIVKADASLSSAIDTDPRARDLLRSVTLMGRTLGLEMVVEGIERESQLAVLRADDPRAFVQGFLLHRPMPLESLREVLAADSAAGGATGSLLPGSAVQTRSALV